MPDVFISYNREDREVAREVAAGLEAEGFSVWYDAALRAGEYYEEVTESNLRSAGAVVVLWSKRSTNSKWVRAEATVGERSSTLVPALIEDCERPVRFELLQTADLTRWHGDRNDPNWRGFVGDVRAAIARRNGASAHPPKAAATAPARPDDANIETTFWNSIKDGSERADFEAYLARYPRGHFADLARNRIAAAERAARPAPKPQPTAAAPKPPPPKQAPARAAAAPPPPPPPDKPQGPGAVVIAGLGALLAAGVVGFFLMRSNPAPEAEAAPVEEQGPAASAAEPTLTARSDSPAGTASPPAPPAEPPSEPATDQLGNSLDALPIEEEAASEPAPVEPIAADPPPAPAAAPTRTPAPVALPKPGSAKKDCDACPLMASLSGGTFLMGSPDGEYGRNPWEGPQHEVTLRPFRIAVHETTVGEWGACAADGACPPKPASDPNLPVLRVTWREAQGYVKWLSKKTGKTYRLPSEAEWEYAARGGTAGAYWWGDRFEAASLARGAVKPVGSFEPNPFGLHDMLSNAREWVEDCYINNFTQTPRDGSAAKSGDCSARVIRGGSWSSEPRDARVANRSRIDQTKPVGYMGFRVAAEAE